MAVMLGVGWQQERRRKKQHRQYLAAIRGGKRRCGVCLETLPLSKFQVRDYGRGKKYVASRCRACALKVRRALRKRGWFSQ